VRRGNERRDNMLRDAIDNAERTRAEGRGEDETKIGETTLLPLRTGHRAYFPNTQYAIHQSWITVYSLWYWSLAHLGMIHPVRTSLIHNPHRPISSGIGLATVKSLLEEQNTCVVAISRSTNDVLMQLQSRHSSRLVQVHGDM
jgi:hypothetical protein